MTPYTVNKISDAAVKLPSGAVLDTTEFIQRAGGCGFDTSATLSMFNMLKDGGYWVLQLSSKQVKTMEGYTGRPRAKGF